MKNLKNLLYLLCMIIMLGMVASCEKDDPVEPEGPSDDPNAVTLEKVTVKLGFTVPEGEFKGVDAYMENPEVFENTGWPVSVGTPNEVKENPVSLTIEGGKIENLYGKPVTIHVCAYAYQGDKELTGAIYMKNVNLKDYVSYTSSDGSQVTCTFNLQLTWK